MNASLPLLALAPARPKAAASHARRLRSLLALFTVYAATLAAVALLDAGADVGGVLTGVAGHVLYATARCVREWRAALRIDRARAVTWRRRLRAA